MTGAERTTLLLFLVACCAGCAVLPVRDDSGPRALGLRDELRRAGIDYLSPVEFRSFSDTVTRAEVLESIGRKDEAEGFYRLALMKGSLMRAAAVPPSRVPADASRDVTKGPVPVAAVAVPPAVVPVPAVAPPAPPPVPPIADDQPEPAAPLPEAAVPPASRPSAPSDAVEPGPEPAPAAPTGPAVSPGERFLAEDAGFDDLPAGERCRVVGTRAPYQVRKGDTLKRIGARLGVDWRQLARSNGLDQKARLQAGQVLYYDNHRIVPTRVQDGIVINIPDRTLYLFKGGRVHKSYPVAVGRPQKPDDDLQWMTPTGRFTITAKQKDPTWRVPPSIQEEMERKGEEVVTEIPPGNDNPLGKYALRTTLPGIMIHGTISPASIFTFSSHGCVRVGADHMEELFRSVNVRTPGEIVYQPVKLLVSRTGRVYLEVHRDVYNVYRGDLLAVARRLIRSEKIADRVDWGLVSRAVRASSGIPVEVSGSDGLARSGEQPGPLTRRGRSDTSGDS